MDEISRGRNSGRSQAEIAAMMGGGGMASGAAPDMPEGSQGATGFERLISAAQRAEDSEAADEPTEETG